MRFTCNSIAIRLPHIINDSPLQMAPVSRYPLYYDIPSIKNLVTTPTYQVIAASGKEVVQG
jgi:hypothetical protein